MNPVNTDAITIRQCTASDWQELRAVMKQTFEDAFKAQTDPINYNAYTSTAFLSEKIKEELADPKAIFFFLIENNTQKVAGYLKMRWDRSDEFFGEIRAIEIQRIYFYKQFWGKGYGKTLLEFTENWGRENNYAFAWLVVWFKNESAMRFYVREGWETFARKNFQFGSAVHNDYVFRKQL